MATQRLSREDWVGAALQMVGELGLDRLKIEPLATRLGTTKGSFYWHFKDRTALLEATLEHWETQATEAVIREVDREPDPERLAALLARVSRSHSGARAELAILASAEDPQVRPIVQRVHRTRLKYLTERLTALGLPTERAAARAGVCYSAYLGGLLLDRAQSGRRQDAAHQSELLLMITGGDRTD